ncbi:hypothetical protein FRC12_020605 [Ceratobasidium sp. 428]|nr:hypothetical protein FRC12_020605 [Ceratobasidium sp. 428]
MQYLYSLISFALGPFSPHSYSVRSVQTSGDLPLYALAYAPIVHLYSQETFWPSEPSVHLEHVTAKLEGFSNDTSAPFPLTVSNLNYAGSHESVYLTGNDNVEVEPEWLRSTYGKPNRGGRSVARSAIIAVDKGELIGPGYVDIFYPFFYSM